MAHFPRRFLPPISQLCTFEAAARLQSFTAAANELSLTQGAVSRQIRALEDQLGTDLFVRERQTVRLTAAGEAYAVEIRGALRQVSAATFGVRANPNGGVLNLAILPTFGTRWLAPRLPRFLSAHPGITLNLSTRLAPFDFRSDPLDAAIHHGLPDWSGAKLEYLMDETVVPACSPNFLKRHRVKKPADLRQLPLLHLESRPGAWAQWFAFVGTEFQDSSTMLVDQFAVAAQAAIAGIGVALLPEFLIEEELQRGDLVVPVNAPMRNTACYYVAYPQAREQHPPLAAFLAWIRGEALAGGRSAARGPSPRWTG